MSGDGKAAVHPGEILYGKYMQPLGLTQNRVGRCLRVSPRRINQIVHGTRRITADSALRLAQYFGNSPEYWLTLQMAYDLALAEEESGEWIRRNVAPHVSGA